MEQKNREQIIKIDSDLEHIKKDVGDIKDSIAIFIQNTQKMENEIAGLRGRLKGVEHEIIETKAILNEAKSLFWKLFGALGAGGASTVGILEILGK